MREATEAWAEAKFVAQKSVKRNILMISPER
jgi:hypothetical protein